MSPLSPIEIEPVQAQPIEVAVEGRRPGTIRRIFLGGAAAVASLSAMEAVDATPVFADHPCAPGETDVVGYHDWYDENGVAHSDPICADDTPPPPPPPTETSSPPPPPDTTVPATQPPVVTQPPSGTSPATNPPSNGTQAPSPAAPAETTMPLTPEQRLASDVNQAVGNIYPEVCAEGAQAAPISPFLEPAPEAAALQQAPSEGQIDPSVEAEFLAHPELWGEEGYDHALELNLANASPEAKPSIQAFIDLRKVCNPDWLEMGIDELDWVEVLHWSPEAHEAYVAQHHALPSVEEALAYKINGANGRPIAEGLDAATWDSMHGRYRSNWGRVLETYPERTIEQYASSEFSLEGLPVAAVQQ